VRSRGVDRFGRGITFIETVCFDRFGNRYVVPGVAR
jgi:hypothetical protein